MRPIRNKICTKGPRQTVRESKTMPVCLGVLSIFVKFIPQKEKKSYRRKRNLCPLGYITPEKSDFCNRVKLAYHALFESLQK